MGRVRESKAREKKLIRAPDDLVEDLSEAAARKGQTFYHYVSEVLEQALRAETMNRSLKEIIDSYELNEVSKKGGAAVVPRDFVEYSVERIYSNGEEDLLNMWRQTGRLHGLFLKGKLGDDIDALAKLVGDSSWLVNDVEVKRGKESVSLRFIAPSISAERSKLFLSFIEGAVESLEFKVVEKSDYRGIIDVKIAYIS